MDYFEAIVPTGNAHCFDERCHCSGTEISRGQGYLCVTRECVDFRRAIPTKEQFGGFVKERIRTQLTGKLEAGKLAEDLDGLMKSIYYSDALSPILTCELGAKRRGLDLEVAAADARHWWRTGQVPLRPTPVAKGAQTNLYCPHCGAEIKSGAEFCIQCGRDLPTEIRGAAAPTQAQTPSDSAEQPICDICAVKLGPAAQRLVSPSEMRIIAGNGYGRNVTLWGQIPPEKRELQFYQLAIMSDTPWGLCPSCYEKTRAYAKDTDGGLSHDDFRNLVMKPLWEAAGVDVQSSPPLRSSAPTIPPSEIHRPAPQQKRAQGNSRRAWFILFAILVLSAAGGILYLRPSPAPTKQRAGDSQAFFDQGMNLIKTRKYAEAAQAFEKAIGIRPDFTEAHSQLGFVYLKLGRGNDGIESLKRAINSKPDDPRLHRNLGEIYRFLGRWREAIDSYRRAISLKSDYAAAYNEMGFVYRKMREPLNAIDAYKQAVLIKPDYFQAQYGLGLAYLDIDDHVSANQQYETLQKLKRPDLAKKLKKWIHTEEPAENTDESDNRQP